MSSDDGKEGVKLSLTVILNKEGNKVLFAVADNHFTDILLSFLTLPLGRVVKVLEKHYGDEAPSIGSLSSLYRSIASLDGAHFVTEGAKETVLDSRSSPEAEYEKLRIDISDPPPLEYFFCGNCSDRFLNVSVFVDRIPFCQYCGGTMSIEVVAKSSEAPPSSTVDEAFTKNSSSFIISDDLQILPSETEFLRITGILGITDANIGKSIKVDLGFGEIMKLLKASLTSPMPLSDVILNKATRIYYPILTYQTKESCATVSGKFILKVMIQNSKGKLLFAQAKKDFVEFLFSLLYIPLGGVENLLGGKTACFKAIDNLYRSTSEFLDEECFSNTVGTKYRLMKPTVVHGCISPGHILRLAQELSPADFCSSQYSLASTARFPNGKGAYLQGSQTYKVTDDLTVVPYCFVSILTSLREQKVLLSDVKEVEVKIGFEEGLSILKASLTSTHALSNALFNHISIKKPKTEACD